MLALLIALVSQAGGHYHPPDIAGRSAVYTKASDKAGQTFRDRAADVEVMAKALVDYREALDLMGDKAPSAERERLERLQKQFNRDRAVLEAFANTMMEDFDGEFSAALSRALPQDAVQCQAMIPTGPALPGIPSPMEENPDCTGADLNAQLAKALDQDAALKKAVDEILSLEWPTVRAPAEAQAPVGPSDQWIAAQPWMRSVIGRSLSRIDDADEAGRLEFQAALENDPSTDEMKAMVASARALTDQTANAKAQAAAPVLAAVDTWNGKKAKKGLDVGWCANPEALGGCTGDDVTRTVGASIKAYKAVIKAATN